MTHLSQEVSCGKSHRAAAYYGHALAGVFFTFRNEDIACKVSIGRESLELLNSTTDR